MLLLKNANLYAPKAMGLNDILIGGSEILAINSSINLETNINFETIDLKGKTVVPGFIDSHVHILGGGGEGSYKTRTPEITLSTLTTAGITTVIGCLGTDSVTRSMTNLIAKSRGLSEEGITTHIYTGSYEIPVKTYTGTVKDDIVMIDKIIGVGEIAASDHRSSQPTYEEFIKVVSDARVGGMLSGKCGIVNVHIGKGKRQLELLEKMVDETEIPITQVLPTHLNRDNSLLETAIRFANKGGLIDLTTSSGPSDQNTETIKCSKGLKELLAKGVSIEQISFSSDAQGSLPIFDSDGKYIGLGVGDAQTLFGEVRSAILDEQIPIETAIQVITSNPARNLKLNSKGILAEGFDADITVLDNDLKVDSVFAMGKAMILEGKILQKGTFE